MLESHLSLKKIGMTIQRDIVDTKVPRCENCNDVLWVTWEHYIWRNGIWMTNHFELICWYAITKVRGLKQPHDKHWWITTCLCSAHSREQSMRNHDCSGRSEHRTGTTPVGGHLRSCGFNLLWSAWPLRRRPGHSISSWNRMEKLGMMSGWNIYIHRDYENKNVLCMCWLKSEWQRMEVSSCNQISDRLL